MVEEAVWFAEKLGKTHRAVEALIVNRVHPSLPRCPDLPISPSTSALAALVENLAEYREMNRMEEDTLADLVGRVENDLIARIPLFEIDVSDVGGLVALADHF